MDTTITDDDRAILLLCAGLERRAVVRPLTPTEYDRLATRLHGESARPADLLTRPDLAADLAADDVLRERLTALLARGLARH